MAIPVISVAQMREWEQATWASGQTEEAVIRQAGQAVARVAEQMTQPNAFILVLAGKGHNGDDAQLAAEFIREREVKVLKVVDPEEALRDLPAFLKRQPALLIDGVFGIGLNRALSAAWIKLIQFINETGCAVLAVDAPSGLNADTGMPMEDAIRARTTLTLGAVKEGMLKASAWEFVGRLEVAPEIGLIPCPFTGELNYITPADFTNYPLPRPQAGHKGTFGHLAIISGSLGYHGAGVLAARGAQRAQPGLITLITDPKAYAPVAGQLQAVMVRPWSTEMNLPEHCTAVLFGPGLASPDMPDYVKEFTRRLWLESPLAVIADASGLGWIGGSAGTLRPTSKRGLRVVTPHPGEAARMLGRTTAKVQEDRPGSLREVSARLGECYVVLKGHQTVIGRSKGPLWVNGSGNPYLGQGGSGDLLSGFVSGLLAQPLLQADPQKAIAYAVWEHGAAADRLQETRSGWLVEDLAEVLGRTR